MGRLEELRLITKVATLYHRQGLRQAEIADQLDLSQASVSRLLKRGESEGIVRVTIAAPMGVYPQLEDALKERYGLKEVIVVDGSDDPSELLHHLGAAAAYYVESTLQPDEQIGISSWSETLLAMTRSMRPIRRSTGARVIQILGGVGDPAAAVHATQLTRGLASLVNGDFSMLPAPGVVGAARARKVLLDDPYVQEAVQRFDAITLALVGIGTVEPSPMLARSGNVFTQAELAALSKAGAVGDICLRFFDAEGEPVDHPLGDRVIGIELHQLRGCRRSVGIAGGTRKLAAIRGALLGRWVNVLITDARVAEGLLAEQSESTSARPKRARLRAAR
ncbi:MAG TPA: sugar-binding transcriptional regulator [Gemmatimonadaceae bacterium]